VSITSTGQRPQRGTAPADSITAKLLELLSPLDLLRIAPMEECETLSGLSEDSLTRHHSDKIIHLSPRRKGMRVGDALMLRNPDATKA
jgi:hypothetical protein